MAVEREDGSFVADDGSIHYSGASAGQADANYASKGGGTGGGAMGGMAGGFLAIFIFGPILLAKLVGFLWGLLLKLGIVGRVLTTGLMLIAGPFMAMIIMGLSQELFRGLGRVGSGIVIVSAALLPAAWYFLWHYDAVKLMGASTFSAKVGTFAKFVWFGFLGACLLALFKSNGALRAVISIGASIAGIVFYLISTIRYAREASENPTIRIPLAVKGIVMAAVVGVIVIYGIAAKVEVAADKAKSAAHRELVSRPEERAKYNEADHTGKTITVSTSSGDESVNLRAEPSAASRLLETLDSETKLTVTGKLSGLWVPVNYNGTSGWVFAPLVLTDTRTRLFDEDRLLPYKATIAVSVDAYTKPYEGYDRLTFESGTEVIVNNHSTGYQGFEYKNADYYLRGSTGEFLNYVEPEIKVRERPAEFQREFPFSATVTEDIDYHMGNIAGSIPTGTTVTVTGHFSSSGISRAFVEYNGQKDIYVYWKYLKPVN